MIKISTLKIKGKILEKGKGNNSPMSAELMMTDEKDKKSSIIAGFSSFYKTVARFFLCFVKLLPDFPLFIKPPSSCPLHLILISWTFVIIAKCFFTVFAGFKFSTQMPECGASILFQTGFILVAMSTETKSVVVGVRWLWEELPGSPTRLRPPGGGRRAGGSSVGGRRFGPGRVSGVLAAHRKGRKGAQRAPLDPAPVN